MFAQSMRWKEEAGLPPRTARMEAWKLGGYYLGRSGKVLSVVDKSKENVEVYLEEEIGARL